MTFRENADDSTFAVLCGPAPFRESAISNATLEPAMAAAPLSALVSAHDGMQIGGVCTIFS
jgi:hypothetical protein